jgi:hypothetical protein
MFSKKSLVSVAIVLASAWNIAGAQNDAIVNSNVNSNVKNSVKSNGTTVWSQHAAMTVVPESAPSSNTKPRNRESGLVTIFSNLASKYRNGQYWCCTGYNIMGPGQNLGEQWIAAAFKPTADHTVTTITVAAGYTQGATNGVVLALYSDSNGKPGKSLKSWSLSNLPNFGVCCTLVTGTTTSGIAVSAGKQYWVVLKTNGTELDTVDGWNVEDTDQVNPSTLAVFPGTHNAWNVFTAAPGVGFAVEGN